MNNEEKQIEGARDPKDHDSGRRNFIRTAGIGSAAAVIGGALGAGAIGTASAATDSAATDPRLRGGKYAVPELAKQWKN